MMPSEARQNVFQGPINIYLQHLLQTLIYYMKIHSQNIYFKNTLPLPPPGGRLKLVSSPSNKHLSCWSTNRQKYGFQEARE